MNRYYYDAYLVTRELFRTTTTISSTLSHKGYPAYLQGHYKDSILRHIKRATRIGAFSSTQEKKARLDLLGSVSELANMLTTSYTIRVIADYEIEIEPAISSPNVFTIGGVSSTAAASWIATAQLHSKIIAKYWTQAGGTPIRSKKHDSQVG